MDEIKEEKAGLSASADRKIMADEGRGEGIDDAPDEDRGKDGRLLGPEDKVYDLVDIYDDQGGMVSREELQGAGITEQSVEGILRSGNKGRD